MALLTDTHRAAIGTEVSRETVQVTRRDIQKYASATEQQQQKYIDGDEAPPMFFYNLFNQIPALAELRADGLAPRGGPDLPLNRIMAGGIEIEQHRPIRAGDELVGVRRITDIYEKTGKSGPLIFVVRELAVHTTDGDPVMHEVQTSIVR